MIPNANRVHHPKPPTMALRKVPKAAKGAKTAPQRVAATTSYNDDDEEYVVAAKCDFKRQAHQLNEHFEKLLESACLNYVYPVEHKLKECTMMKNFMTSLALSKG
jgi:ribosomal 50S subunit-associated protein YjgA (DUF615 family)